MPVNLGLLKNIGFFKFKHMATSHDAPSRLTPQEWLAILSWKKIPVETLAKRWGVSKVWVYAIARNPDRACHYDDALIGLPNANSSRPLRNRDAQVAAAMRGLRPKSAVKKERPLPPSYRYKGYLVLGSIVTASSHVGSIAEEGDRGIVVHVEDDGKQQRFGVIFESGQSDFFLPDHVDTYLASTGLIAPAMENYRYTDDATLGAEFDRGLFEFWPTI